MIIKYNYIEIFNRNRRGFLQAFLIILNIYINIYNIYIKLNIIYILLL